MCQLSLKVIACEIVSREITHVAARSRNLIDLEFMTQGLHESPRAGRAQLQERIDAAADGKYDAILLGYGLCASLVHGLAARGTQLVVPRAHDCVTLLLGSKERYGALFDRRVGTYFLSSGWLECMRRRAESEQVKNGEPPFPTRAAAGGRVHEAYDKWVKQYGDECACHLLNQIGKTASHYSHGTLIHFDFAGPLGLDQQAREICAQRGWEYEQIPGDLSLLRRWLDGEWNADAFQVVAPGERLVGERTEGILGIEKLI